MTLTKVISILLFPLILVGCDTRDEDNTGNQPPQVSQKELEAKAPDYIVVRYKDGEEPQMASTATDVEVSKPGAAALEESLFEDEQVKALDDDDEEATSSESFLFGVGGKGCYGVAGYSGCRPQYKYGGGGFFYNFLHRIKSKVSGYTYLRYKRGHGYGGGNYGSGGYNEYYGGGHGGGYEEPYRPGYELDPRYERESLASSILPNYAGYSEDRLAMIEVGESWFHDEAFSLTGDVSCATCHIKEAAFQDHKPVGVGVGVTNRNTPSLANVGSFYEFFWDGRAKSLQEQAKGPIEASKEHGASRVKAARIIYDNYQDAYYKLWGKKYPSALAQWFEENGHVDAVPEDKDYVLGPKQAKYVWSTIGAPYIIDWYKTLDENPIKALAYDVLKGDERNQDWIDRWDTIPNEIKVEIELVYDYFAEAVAAYQQTIRTTSTPFDEFAKAYLETGDLAGSFNPGFGEEEYIGWTYFVGKAKCAECHNGAYFSDMKYHNIGVEQSYERHLDIGRAGALFKESDGRSFPKYDVGAFKTQSLRNIAATNPYFHDGSADSLWDVLLHYNEAGYPAAVGERSHKVQPLYLSHEDLKYIEKFLYSLSSDIIYYESGRY